MFGMVSNWFEKLGVVWFGFNFFNELVWFQLAGSLVGFGFNA
jgi:hypothetical protein